MSWNPNNYQFAWNVVSEYRVWLWEGVLLTLKIAAVSMALAMVLALFIALMRMSPIWPLRTLASIYIAVMRAIPLLVFILWGYYGVALVLGLNIDAFWSGVLCLMLQYSAWLAEIYRSGLQAIDRGLSRTRAFAKVIWPQAWRIIIPPLASNFIGIIKDSSLVGIIGLNELMRQSQISVSLTFRPFEIYTAAMIIYIILALVISRLASVIEQRAARSLSVHARRVPRTTQPLESAA
jgi:His/Glu/Gln/Arg/opine family amino acid ABC transporter permease subunit